MIQADAGQYGVLLKDSFQFLDPVAEAFEVRSDTLRMDLSVYVNGLLHSQRPHDRERLRTALRNVR